MRRFGLPRQTLGLAVLVLACSRGSEPQAPRPPEARARTCAPDALPEGMQRIEGGRFDMGALEHDRVERPVHAVDVNAFMMGIHEVTVGEYARCVEAKICSEPLKLPNCSWGKARKAHPVTCVSWQQATVLPARGCPPKRNGNSPREAAWRTRPIRGAKRKQTAHERSWARWRAPGVAKARPRQCAARLQETACMGSATSRATPGSGLRRWLATMARASVGSIRRPFAVEAGATPRITCGPQLGCMSSGPNRSRMWAFAVPRQLPTS
jgi:hypothetical protein